MQTEDIHILIIDDDRDVCDYMELLLEQEGYNVETRTAPADGIRTLREETFHVVVVDLMMPEIDGIEALDRIRDFDGDVAIIVFTGYPSVDTARESMQYDVSDYIEKPFDVDEFNAALERVLREKGLLHEPVEQLLETIGQNLRERRKECGLTLEQASRRTGLSVSLLSQIERAESSASVSSLYKLAQALDCRVTDFFGDY
ncbi:MAG: response regulator [Bradymonadaceae bacterium]